MADFDFIIPAAERKRLKRRKKDAQVLALPIAADDLHPGLQHLVAQRVISRAVAKDALVVTNEQRKRLGMQL